MKIQSKTPIIFFAFFLFFAPFVSFVVPSSSAQKAGGMLYVGTWPRQVLVIDEVAGKVVDQIQLNTGTPQSLTLSYDKKKIYATTWNNGVEVIDLATRKVVNHFVLNEGERNVRIRRYATDERDKLPYR